MRATMESKLFNSLAILNIHKDLTDQIDLIEVVKELSQQGKAD